MVVMQILFSCFTLIKTQTSAQTQHKDVADLQALVTAKLLAVSMLST